MYSITFRSVSTGFDHALVMKSIPVEAGRSISHVSFKLGSIIS